MRRLMVVLAVWALSVSSFAELRLATVFSEGMVLQRDQQVAVWGWTDPGADVVVSFAGQQKAVKAGTDGKFMVRLDKMKASAEPQPLVVKAGADAVEVKNVLVGEVWLCSGQSNMQRMVEKAMNFDKEKAAANFPEIRMFTTVQTVSVEPLSDCEGSWIVCSPETVGALSAVAYFFGREIHQALDVPVGLMQSSWGGTCIEAWSPLESLADYPLAMKTFAGYERGGKNFTLAAEEKRFAKVHGEWEAKAAVAKANGKPVPFEPRKRGNPRLHQNCPGNLYNAMIHPLVPYTMRGAIWYQGERNAKTYAGAMEYRGLLENLVTRWRADWNNDFPFYAVQLVNYMAPQTKPVENTAWAYIRDSILKFHKEVPNVGIAVGIDVGEAKEIHPINKQAIGYRLAQQALAKTYGMDVVPGGPIYQSMVKDGGKIVVAFDDIGSGLVAQGGAPLKRFAIAGADRKFVVAKAVIVGDTVVVSSDQVADPVAVRYAWASNPVGCNLFNKEGFPASPFRTDDWAPAAE
jgi:sialate O-acetylesterase